MGWVEGEIIGRKEDTALEKADLTLPMCGVIKNPLLGRDQDSSKTLGVALATSYLLSGWWAQMSGPTVYDAQFNNQQRK